MVLLFTHLMHWHWYQTPDLCCGMSDTDELYYGGYNFIFHWPLTYCQAFCTDLLYCVPPRTQVMAIQTLSFKNQAMTGITLSFTYPRYVEGLLRSYAINHFRGIPKDSQATDITRFAVVCQYVITIIALET